MITIDSLTVRYGQKTVLDRLTMHLAEGPCTAWPASTAPARPPSSRRSSTRAPRRGEHHPLRRRPAARSQIAYMPAESFFYDGMTGRDLLELTARYHPERIPRPGSRPSPLPADQPVGEWSAGMRRKLALAATLMQRREVVLLDEPFNGLDMESRSTSRSASSSGAGTKGPRSSSRRTCCRRSRPLRTTSACSTAGASPPNTAAGSTPAPNASWRPFHARYTNLFPDRKIN